MASADTPLAEGAATASAATASKVPLSRQINYGLGMFGANALVTFQLTFLILFYTQTVGLSASLAGIALMAGRVWDAVTDPAMGNFSDRTRLRMGRRRPYMFFGAIPLALSYIALWTPPDGWSQTALFFYLLATYVAFNTFITVVLVPYVSLGGELSTDYHERTRLMAIRMVFQTLGWYVGATGIRINQFLLDHASTGDGLWQALATFREGYAMCAVILGAGTVFTMMWSAYWVKEDPDLRVQPYISHLAAFWRTLQNRAFLVLMIAFLGASLFESMGFAFFPFLIGYWYYLGDMEAMSAGLPYLMLPLLLITFPALAFWTYVSRRLGKKRAFLLGLAMMALTTALNFFMITPHTPWLFWPWILAFGVAASCTNLLTPAIIPDIVDEEELETGGRREGSFFGMQTFALKLAGAFGAGLAGVVLGLIGFQEGAAEQSDATIFWIRNVYAFLRGGGYLLSLLVMLWFPLSAARVAYIRSQLDERNATEPAEEI